MRVAEALERKAPATVTAAEPITSLETVTAGPSVATAEPIAERDTRTGRGDPPEAGAAAGGIADAGSDAPRVKTLAVIPGFPD